jgi:ribonuclease BN (tRNA processing enzyme)
MMKHLLMMLAVIAPAFGSAQAQGRPVEDAAGAPMASRWITLGTRGGPMASATRSQPANLLFNGSHAYLVDVGDGAIGQAAKAGVPGNRVEAVFISHLHFDHTGGLAALLGLRWQTNPTHVLRIYGPPGTKAMVDGLIASMTPGTTAGYGVPGAPQADPRDQVQVVELRDKGSITLDGMRVSVRKNTHYSFTTGSDSDQRFESLSLRFQLPDRAIVYTGDTGPSRAVEELANGADLLVAEMMDLDDTIQNVRRNSPDLNPRVLAATEQHLRTHHLMPEDVGVLAKRAGVGGVVVTHFVGREPTMTGHFAYLRAISKHYTGPATIADDMDVF